MPIEQICSHPQRFATLAATLLTAMGCLVGCGDSSTPVGAAPAPGPVDKDKPTPAATPGGAITLYAGRSLALVEPVIKQFEQQTGVKVHVKTNQSPALAGQLQSEGAASPADVFWSQDVASLGAVAQAGLLAKLPEQTLQQVAAKYRDGGGTWIGASGRARVLAYSPKRVKAGDLPRSVFELTDAKWKGRIGWAPANGSFQAFVTAMRLVHGDDKTKQWLIAMKANAPREYPKNTPIIEALASGEIDLGLPNHYYLLRAKAQDADYPVAQTFFEDGSVGNLMFIAGAGVLKSSKNKPAAEAFVAFLVSDWAQQYFTEQVFEYPVTAAVKRSPQLVDDATLLKALPDVDLNKIEDLTATQAMLREAGLL